MITLGSLFDGIGGFPLAAVHNGIIPIWASEIESFPIEVTKIRFPDMLHVGDITKLKGEELPPVDIITGGSPCQDLSVAGTRAGLAGERSGLFMEQIRITKEMRWADARRGKANHLIRPRYFVWENVPGAFSSAGGEDFKAVLEETTRIADSTYLYLDLREGYGNLLGAYWDTNSLLLGEFSMLNTGVSLKDAKESFLSQILEDTPHQKYYLSRTACLGILRRSKAKGKELPKQLKIALEIQGEVKGAEENHNDNGNTECKAYHINQRNEGIDLNGISGALMATQNMQIQTFVTEPMICLNDQGGERMDVTENITPTLRSSMGGNQPIVMATQQGGAEICVGLCPTITSAAGTSGNNQPVLFDNHAKDCRYNGPLKVAPTIAATYGTGGNNVPLVSKSIITDSYCIAGNTIDRQDHNGGNGCGFQENISYTLTTSDIHAVCFPSKTYQDKVGALCESDEKGIGNQYVSQNKCIVDSEKMVFAQSEFANYKEGCGTLRAGGGDNGGGSKNLVTARNLVRRLTPLECERLQGFPDGWTKIEKSSDSGRYKALGNSVAIPCVDYIMRGIAYFMKKFNEEGEE